MSPILKAILALAALIVPIAHAEAPATPARYLRAVPQRFSPVAASGAARRISKKVPGVIEVESGYTAGKTDRPSYEEVSSGATGHTEAVRVIYDPKKVSYPQLVDFFWRHMDPTVKDRQFCDIGTQYRSGIYWQNDAERKAAEESRDALIKSGKFKTIYTELAPATTFWLAETYHQDYYKKNPIRYNYYRASCGRDARVEKIWAGK